MNRYFLCIWKAVDVSLASFSVRKISFTASLLPLLTLRMHFCIFLMIVWSGKCGNKHIPDIYRQLPAAFWYQSVSVNNVGQKLQEIWWFLALWILLLLFGISQVAGNKILIASLSRIRKYPCISLTGSRYWTGCRLGNIAKATKDYGKSQVSLFSFCI